MAVFCLVRCHASFPVKCLCDIACIQQQQSLTSQMQACKSYHEMLQKVYGPELVLKPHVMSANVLETEDADGESSFLLSMTVLEGMENSQHAADNSGALFLNG